MTLLLIACGGAIGAPLRYLIDSRIRRRHDTPFPWGTFAVNVVGSVVLGLLTGLALAGSASPGVVSLLGTGLCGALTTFSTFGYQTVRLFTERATGYALANAALTAAAGLAAAALGMLVGTALG